VQRVLDAEGAPDAETAVILVEPETIRDLNREHREIDEVTDVLAFPIDELDDLPEGVPRLLGDVVICLARVREQAAALDHPPGRELAILATHGTLHLLGYDHETDDGEMAAREEELCPDGVAVLLT
jgi:probable rRNA maturation factor